MGTGNLYTFQPGSSSYTAVPLGTLLTGGYGYWANFAGATAIELPASGPQTITRSLPAGQYAMIGNPGDTWATVSGADCVYTYDPSGGYSLASALAPGQGAWAITISGGSVTIAGSGQAAAPVSPPPSSVPGSSTLAPPTAPSDLAAEVLGSTMVQLTWTSNSTNEDGFQIYDTNFNADISGARTPAGTTTFTLTVQPNGQFCVAVYAFNAAGNSDFSNSVCFTTGSS